MRGVLADGGNELRPLHFELQQSPLLDLVDDEGDLSLAALHETLSFQYLDRLAHGDACHLELGLELLEGGDLLSRLPLSGLDTATQRRRHLQVKGNTAAFVGFCQLQLVTSRPDRPRSSPRGVYHPTDQVLVVQRVHIQLVFLAHWLEAFGEFRDRGLLLAPDCFRLGNVDGDELDRVPGVHAAESWQIGRDNRRDLRIAAGGLVVAAIRGYCFGVGFELSLACDFRIVSETAELTLPEQRIGMIPGSGGSARLVKMIGLARTKDMAMRSRRISGPQAVEWGIALECVADDQLEAKTDAFVEELRSFSPLAQRTLKGVLNAAEDAPLAVAIELEGQAYGRLRSSDDFREGVESFYEKRKPVFKGT